MSFEFLENRTLLTCANNDVCVDFDFVDPVDVNTPLDSLEVGQDVLMNVSIRDNRTIPFGIFQAYFDMTYNAALASINGAISYEMQYSTRESGDTSVAGVLDAIGATSTGLPTPASDSFLLFTLPLTADAQGTLTFTAQPDDHPFNKVEFFDIIDAVDNIGYTGDSIEIVNSRISITPPSGLNTTEGGGMGTFEIVLTVQPTGNVSIGLSSSDTSEGTVSTNSVMFTTGNWDTPQPITVTGVNEDVDDGDIEYSIITAPVVSSDLDFSGMDALDVSVTNTDDDDTGIVVSPTSGLTTTEGGGTANFTIELTSEPTFDVTIGLTSSRPDEGLPSTDSVIFTPNNWDTPQRVTVTGQNDGVDDDDVSYTILTAPATSGDSGYSGVNADDVSLDNTDDDDAGITVIAAPGLMTSESGSTAMFQIVLDSEPTADLTIGLSSSHPAEGTLSVGSVTFTPENWDIPQAVTVTGQDDNVDDGDVNYTVATVAATSGDANYNNLDADDVSLINTDDDTAGITVTSTVDLVTTEGGITAMFDIRLDSEPTANVIIGISSSNTDEGTVSASSVTFTSQNWDTAQTITVAGQDDDVSDGNISYTIDIALATSGDSSYAGLNAPDVSVTNQDDDVVGIDVSPVNGLVTTEVGGQAAFNVVLTSQPTAGVTIGVSSSEVDEGIPSVSSLTFTPGNWDSRQTVTVTGQDDDVDDGDAGYMILTAPAASIDTNYNGFNADDVSLSNTDNDVAGIDVSHASGLTTTEAGGTVSFDIVLTSEPTGDVTISLTSSDSSEGEASTSSVTFNPSNWHTPQTVVVTGQNDDMDDGDMSYTIVTAAASSNDPFYSSQNANDVPVMNLNDDSTGITVTPPSGLTTTEVGGMADFTIALTSQPTADVVIGLSTSDNSEGTASANSVTFTSEDWDLPQTVTVTGANDAAPDGDVSYMIITASATSSDLDYNGLDADDVSLTNLDNDILGVTISPLTGLETTEEGGTASFTIVLDTQPQADVTIGLSASNTDEGVVSTASVTFTIANWNVAQMVTVTGQDDMVDDGDVDYVIVTTTATSSDSDYSGLVIADVSLKNVDNDRSGISVSLLSGLETTEAGGTAVFTIVLDTAPTAEVTIEVSSSDTTEGSVSTGSISFDSSNWSTPQTIVVTGEDDQAVDGDIGYMIVTAQATSSDPAYSLMNPTDVSVTNLDNDIAGISAFPVAGVETSEAGDTSMFAIVLHTQPADDVSIGISSDNAGEGTPSTASVTFNPSNWDTPQTITVTGQDDGVDDGNVGYQIVTSAATSNDSNYNGLSVDDVSLTNIDDDEAGIDVSPLSGLTTTEAGGTVTFSIVLESEPITDVTVDLSSSNTTEGIASPSSVTFNASNWDTPQTVTITGQDDNVDDGDVSYSIVTAAASSGDANYNGLNATDVSVSNTDDDVAGITVSPSGDLVTSEDGGTAAFTIVLDSQPTANVTIGLTSNDATEGTVSTAGLTFTPQTWDAPQTVTITGQDDPVVDGDVSYTVITEAGNSSDLLYVGLDVEDVSVSNSDNDTPGVIVIPTSGLVTSENGQTATFTVRLNTQPMADVTIGLSSTDTSEGTISTDTLVFTSGNWDASQTVMITGQADAVDDDGVVFTIEMTTSASSDTDYNGLDVTNVSVTNEDDDTAGITVFPTEGLVTSEAGLTATFTVVLDSEPTADVIIGLFSTDVTEGTLSTTDLTFTPGNWDTEQTLTISGDNDPMADGAVGYMIEIAPAISIDPKYDDLDATDVSVINSDNDIPGITVSPTSGLFTTEDGGTATFSVVLNTMPTADVEIGLTSSNASQGTVSVSSLMFTSVNWDIPRTVTVTDQNADAIADGDIAYMIITSAVVSSGSDYAGMDPSDVSLTNLDNDEAGIVVSPISGLTTSETGATASFTIALTSEPTAEVTIDLSSDDIGKGTVSLASVTFDSSNWDSSQTVTVTGVDDDVDDGDVTYNVVTAPATSSDSNYAGMNGADVRLLSTDDDTAGITVSPTDGLVTSEEGGEATFTIVLDSEPTAPVTISLSSSDTTEGTISVSSVNFTPENWDTPQAVTVTGQDDPVSDGDILHTIVTAAATSGDGLYNGMDSADVSLTNIDDDNPGIRVTATADLMTTEDGGTATFTIELDTQPADDVTISLSSSNSDEGTVFPASVTFAPATWNEPQTVTVTGQDDPVDDGDVAYTIVTGPAVSNDSDYSGRGADEVSLTNIDNDTAGITVSPTDGLTTSENGETAVFTLMLDTQPLADVTIGFSSNDPGEGMVSVSDVTFTPADWDTPREITVNGVDDIIVDSSIAYMVITDPANSADDNYSGLDPDDVSLTNVDNDIPGITIFPISGLATTEASGQATFSVELNTQPLADVMIQLTTSNSTEGTVQLDSVTFTVNDWDMPQTVTVRGQDDNVDDGDVAYTIVTLASSTDTNYDGLEVDDVLLTNTDDDSVGIVVSPTSDLTTTEAGGQATFTVFLASEPTAAVMVGLSSGNADEGTASPGSLTFDASNWDQPQTVTITGQDDNIDDGNLDYTVVVAPATSSDPGYAGFGGDDVSVTNTDDDTAEILVAPTSGFMTSEAGGVAMFTIVLGTLPTADVTIGLSSTDSSEGTLDNNSVTFTPADWDSPRTVTITGQDDADNDGDLPYSIVTAVAVSSDSVYNGMDPADVAVTNTDDDDPGIMVTPNTGLMTTEASGEATFTIQLDTRPTSDATIGLTSSHPDEAIVSTASVTFTPGNWDQPQTVTVTGQDDFVDDGDQNFSIMTTAAVSGDSDYNGLDASDVSATNVDDDIAGFNIVPVAGTTTSEDGTAAQFDISLTSQPAEPVTLGLSTNDAGEGLVSTTSVTFTPGDWNIPQRVSVTGTDDSVVDGNASYLLLTAAAVSNDPAYAGLESDNVGLTNTDDDSASVTIVVVDATLREGTIGDTTDFTFEVSLTGAVEGGFSLAYTTNDGTATVGDGDYLDDDGVLGFDGDDGESQLITVTVNHDSKVEIDEQFSVLLGALSDVDPSVAANVSVDGNPVVATMANDDTSVITIGSGANSEDNAGTSTPFIFEVELSNPVQGGFALAFSTADGTATLADADYVDIDSSLSFTGTAGETQTISVQVTGDNKVEQSEAFSVLLGSLSQFADPALAQSISVSGSPASGSIVNDDMATVAFYDATSTVIEVTGSHSIDVRLSIPGGGTLSEDVTFNIIDALTGSAVTPGDYSLSTPSVMFVAGSSNGETRTVTFAIENDQTLEDDETIVLQLEPSSNDIGGEVVTGSPADHIATIIDDPMNARLSGTVWVDADGDGQRGANDVVVPGVTIELAGTDVRGQTVARTTQTETDGKYEFIDLSGGMYAITQQQPFALNDGQESLGTTAGTEAGQLMDDQFTDIPLGPSEEGVNYDFGEAGLKAQFVTVRFFLASVQNTSLMLHDTIAVAQSVANHRSQTQTILAGPSSPISSGESTRGGTADETLLIMSPALSADQTETADTGNGDAAFAAQQLPTATMVLNLAGTNAADQNVVADVPALTTSSALPVLSTVPADVGFHPVNVTSMVTDSLLREREQLGSALSTDDGSVASVIDDLHGMDSGQSRVDELPASSDDWFLAVAVTDETSSQLGRRVIDVALAEEETWVPLPEEEQLEPSRNASGSAEGESG